MAANTSRNMTTELYEGMTDGTYKKLDANRGGSVETINPQAKSDLPSYYEASEDASPTLPVPNFVKMRGGQV
jgi:hypothetical protein